MIIRKVTILGANGTIGSQVAAIIAAFGNAKVYMVARDLEKAKCAIENALTSIKSDVIRSSLIPQTYNDLHICIPDSDWVFELVTEDITIKHKINQQISKFKRSGTIVSTVTSGLSIDVLAQDFPLHEQKFYFGTHFYNPPYKMLLCELIPNKNSDAKVQNELFDYLQNILHRQVVITHNTPGFLGNRIGFQILNESLQYAEKYQSHGGIALLDYLLGGITGRAMPPIATIDLVGLDVHKAIVDNIYNLTNDSAHESFRLPEIVKYLISQNHLGNKTNAGFYKNENDEKLVINIDKKIYEPIPKLSLDFVNHAKELISESKYTEAFKVIKSDQSLEASIVKHFLERYVDYSLSLIGPVVKDISDIDKAMAYGFNWIPPSALKILISPRIKTNFKNSELDFRSYIKTY